MHANTRVNELSGIFSRESSYWFQRVLAIAILSVCQSVCLSHVWISEIGAS